MNKPRANTGCVLVENVIIVPLDHATHKVQSIRDYGTLAFKIDFGGDKRFKTDFRIRNIGSCDAQTLVKM